MDTKIYTAYDTPPKVVLDDFGPSRTRQSEADAVDINKIVDKYTQTGVLPPARSAAVYADVSQMGDYRSALEHIRSADDMFYKLPSELRAKFHNSPAEFLDVVSDPDNADRLVELGLVAKPTPADSPSETDPEGGAAAAEDAS